MAKRDTRSKAAREAAAKRWAGMTTEERKNYMRTVGASKRVNDEDLAALAWLRENRERLGFLLDSYDNAMRNAIGPEPFVVHLPESAQIPDEPELFAHLESDMVLRSDAELLAAGYVLAPDPETPPALPPPLPELRPILDNCSICLSPIFDLDAPCPTCVAAGRLSSSPPAAAGAAIAELQHAHESQAPRTFEQVRDTTAADVPRISNAIQRKPIPPPEPPLRAYTAQETCRSCGRLAELHMDKGGPLGHNYEPQPPEVRA